MHSFAVVRPSVSVRMHALAFYVRPRPGAMGSRSITRNGMTRRGANIPHPEIKATAVIASSSPKTDNKGGRAGGQRMDGWIYTEHVIGLAASA